MLTTMEKNYCRPGDYELLEQAVKQTYDWIYKNLQATKDEFEAKEKELDDVAEPILDEYGPPMPMSDAEIAEFLVLGGAERERIMNGAERDAV